jgi:hypothetical protein
MVDEDEGPCPRSFECPTCQAKPGRPCMRPSGHQAPEMHVDRLALAGLDGHGIPLGAPIGPPSRLFQPDTPGQTDLFDPDREDAA